MEPRVNIVLPVFAIVAAGYLIHVLRTSSAILWSTVLSVATISASS